jgi:hypothetical protein
MLPTQNKDITLTADSHKRLTEEALPLALDVLVTTMRLSPWEPVRDDVGEPVYNRDGTPALKFNGRINSQMLKAALGTASIVERLGDQALRRQAGGQIKELLRLIKEERPDAFKRGKIIEG